MQFSAFHLLFDHIHKFLLDWDVLKISFIGFETQEIQLEKRVTYKLKVTLKEEAAALDEVVIVSGKQPKKNNPAIDILRKIF